MKNSNILVIATIGFSLLLWGCNSHPNPQNTTLNVDSLNIFNCSISSNDSMILLQSYYLSCSYECGEETLLMGYNDREHALDIFCDSSVVKKIHLERHGENAVPGRLSALNAVCKDSIWMYDGVCIYLINANGEVKFRHKDKDYVFLDANYAMHTATIGWYGNDLLLYPVDVDGVFKIRAYSISGNAVAKEMLLDRPECNSKGDKNYADMKHPNVTFAKNLVIYNYPYDSAIRTINIETGERNCYTASSKHAEDCLKPYKGEKSTDAWLDYGWSNPHYYEVCYLPRQDIYVRPILGGIDTQHYTDRRTIVDARHLYLTFIDKDFNVIGEYELSDKTYFNFHGWCIIDKGLVVFKDNLLNKSSQENLEFDILEPCLSKRR